MTTQPTPALDRLVAQQAAEQFRADLRADLAEIMDELHSQRAELINIRVDLDTIRAGLTQAASQPAPAVGPTETFLADVITFATDENGKQAYKIRGGRYSKNGVRVWDEVLPLLGIDKDLLISGRNPINPPIMVRVEIAKRAGKSDLGEDITLQYNYARKVIGKA